MAQQKRKRPAGKPVRQKKNKKVIRYRKPLNINVGMIIFALIFIYMIFSVYAYVRRDKVRFYEVQEGSIVSHNDYTGIILREEKVKNADQSGYINYYIREGKRASVGTRIYSIDETGSIANYLEANSGEGVTLTGEDLADIKKQLTTFSLTYEDDHFNTVYDTRYTLEADVLEYMNFNALDGAGDLLDQAGINFHQVWADESGVVSYGVDGFEALDAASITASAFDRSNYTKTTTKSGMIEGGTPVYKLITSDLWSVIFEISQDDKLRLADQKTLAVSFAGRGLNATGKFSMFTSTDGGSYGKLDFDKYMVQFVSDRYVDFEIMSDKQDGLKIPVTAVTTKDFYLVPADYLTNGGDSSETGFNKEIYTESGTSVVFMPTDIYYQDGDTYYIDMGSEDGFKAGDYIVKPDSTERYQIGPSASLEGVYNINKGYAVFKQIEVLATNDEYHTVKKNMPYGLAVYDHIVLDASTLTEGQLVYQ